MKLSVFHRTTSPRHGIKVDEAPKRVGNTPHGRAWLLVYSPKDYAAYLDSLYEMADAVMTGNGVSADSAIATVIKDEGWKILPTHIKVIKAMLEKS